MSDVGINLLWGDSIMQMTMIRTKLEEGWVLCGDPADETPFMFFDPKGSGWRDSVPTQWVNEMFDEGVLAPDPKPGEQESYTLRRSLTR